MPDLMDFFYIYIKLLHIRKIILYGTYNYPWANLKAYCVIKL